MLRGGRPRGGGRGRSGEGIAGPSEDAVKLDPDYLLKSSPREKAIILLLCDGDAFTFECSAYPVGLVKWQRNKLA